MYFCHSNLWTILFKNDVISRWAVDYCLDNKDYENEKMKEIIFKYAKSRVVGKYRLDLLEENKEIII